MARQDGSDSVASFGRDLRTLLQDASLSFRALELKAHYSRTTLSQAANGRTLPSLPVTRAYVRACGGDEREWDQRWHRLKVEQRQVEAGSVIAAPAWPPEPVADGSDPESAGCAQNAVTVHARKVALSGRRVIIGQIELRYSALDHAAWARFEGFASLDHIASHRHIVEIAVEIAREPSSVEVFRDEYGFDYHWSSLLCTDGRAMHARVVVCFDGSQVATGESDRIVLL